MPQPQPPEPILALSTLAPDRPTIEIKSEAHPEGCLYEMIAAEDLSLQVQADLASYGKVVEKMGTKKEPTPADAKRLTEVLDRLVAAVVPTLETAVLDALKDRMKVAICEAFIAASPAMGTKVEAKASPSTTAS